MIPVSEILMALRWWGVVMVIGAAAFPLAGWLFAALPDRGYTFTKMLGLLVSGYLFWLLASLGILENSTGGILIGLLGTAGLSLWAAARLDVRPQAWLKERWRYVLTVEILFAALFVLWVWVRAQNPAITATEKPMEFAFLNSATFSPTYPPLDPWLSNFAISYYYFGYVMISAIGRLAQVSPAYGFNLGIAWLVAGSGIGAFGLVYNLTAGRETKRPIFWGGLAAVALPLAGNGQMLLELLHGSGLGSAGFWHWLDIRDINLAPSGQPRFLTAGGTPNGSWWWWRASRVIHEYYLSGRPEEGLEPIAEFPGFSFLLGDMHPHVLALPFAFLSLAVALSWYLRFSAEDDGPLGGLPAVVRLFQDRDLRTYWLLSTVIVGGLSFLNTWDVLIHLFILVGAFVLAQWSRDGWSINRLLEGGLLGVVLVVAVYLLYLPFYLGFSSQAGAPFILPMLMRPTRLAHYGIIFGRSLLVVLMLLLAAGRAYAARGRFWWPGVRFAAALTIGLTLVVFLFVWGLGAARSGFGVINGPTSDLGLVLPQRAEGIDFGWSSTLLAQLVPVYLINRLRYGGLALLLLGMLTAVVALWNGLFERPAGVKEVEPLKSREKSDPLAVLPFVLLLIFTAALLSLGPEFVYLKDNFGQRLNTIFKFYYQAWIFFGAAGLFGLEYLWRRSRPLGGAVTAVYGLLLAVALLYPLQGVRSRAVEYRGPAGIDNRRPATLYGLDFLARSQTAELEAIQWLQNNTPADAVIIEATGNPYSYYARFSANSGRPTVLGWANHEFQWRGDSTAEPALRGPLVDEIYETTDWQRAIALLNQFRASYIVVGSLERNDYGSLGLEKFSQNLTPVFSNEIVTIYPWQPGQQQTGRPSSP